MQATQLTSEIWNESLHACIPGEETWQRLQWCPYCEYMKNRLFVDTRLTAVLEIQPADALTGQPRCDVV